MRIGVVGGGPAGLIAAETLASAGAHVTVIEHMASVGRKFLLAGRGGLNLTHSEDVDAFVGRYRNASAPMLAALGEFGPVALRAWADGLGAETFVGSSGRVFPAAFRAAPLLRAWLARLEDLGVEIRTRCEWVDWPMVVRDRGGVDEPLEVDAIVLACGGASWPRTGSDGRWTDRLPSTELLPSNVGLLINWSELFRARFAGSPLKDVAVAVGEHRGRGDAVITPQGIEGGAVYAISSAARDELVSRGHTDLVVDFRPDQSFESVRTKLSNRREKESVAGWLPARGCRRWPSRSCARCQATQSLLTLRACPRWSRRWLSLSPVCNRSTAPSRRPGACPGPPWMIASCCETARASSWPVKCSTGMRPPAAIYSKRVSARASPPPGERCGGPAPSEHHRDAGGANGSL